MKDQEALQSAPGKEEGKKNAKFRVRSGARDVAQHRRGGRGGRGGRSSGAWVTCWQQQREREGERDAERGSQGRVGGAKGL